MIWFERIARIRILQHIAFWSISFFILLKNFQASSELAPTDYIYTGIFSIFILAAVYMNLLILIPRLFQEGKYLWYFISLACTLICATYIQMIGFDVLIELIFPGYYLISYFEFWGTFKYFIILVGTSSLLHFSKSWFLYKESQSNLMISQREKTVAELETLKNQINPHFLFNSLNSIYSLVLNKENKAPEALIRLSDTMRYIIYESNEGTVELTRELDFISNYIELQKLRMSTKDTLVFDINGDAKNYKVAPLLLIPIIENAFKYGIKGEVESSFVRIQINITDAAMVLLVKNNIGEVDSVERTKAAGMGLTNLKKRLELIYPKTHELNINKSEDTFYVKLKIEL